MNYWLAIDIGASSGRHIVGWQENGTMQTREVYRFPNGVSEQDGHLVWNMDALEASVREGIEAALAEFPRIESLSVDTWGVDYVLMKGDEPVLPCYAYRDSRTEAVIPLVHEKMPFAELYRRTGIQFQPFNTVYQLYADREAGRLEGVTDFLMIPEYLMYRLCGVKSHEYTNATTGGMISAATGEFDAEIVRALELPERLFRPLQQPGTVIGEYRGIRVMLCATHDTGSAVEGIPMEGTRYQKNIMGMWIVNRLRDELCPGTDWSAITAGAQASRFEETVDANDARFLAPKSMKEAFDAALGEKPAEAPDYFRCAYRSLALSYRDAIGELQRNTGKEYSRLYIVGGGAKNAFLNRLTEEATGKQVIALPIEATALGNLRIQMEHSV